MSSEVISGVIVSYVAISDVSLWPNLIVSYMIVCFVSDINISIVVISDVIASSVIISDVVAPSVRLYRI